MADPELVKIEHTPVSLRGEEGRQVALNLGAIVARRMTVTEAGPAFGYKNGTLSIEVDDETFIEIDKILNPQSDEQPK